MTKTKKRFIPKYPNQEQVQRLIKTIKAGQATPSTLQEAVCVLRDAGIRCSDAEKTKLEAAGLSI